MKMFITNVVAGVCFAACMAAETVYIGFRYIISKVCYGVGYIVGYTRGATERL